MPALRLGIVKRRVGTSRSSAGKPFTVGLPDRRSDTNQPVAFGSVGCRVTVGGRKLAAVGRIAPGADRFTFTLPADARGAAVRGTITVRSGGKAVSDDFAYVVL